LDARWFQSYGRSMTWFRFLPLVFAAASLILGPSTASAGSPDGRPIVVELYTSQGCSSCPPADQLLGRLAARPDVIAMSLPITYWDMLGWKDTLASEANTRRQKAYATAMGHGGVYTPQIIVDGVTDVVGSRVADVDSAIAERQVIIANGIAVAVAHADAARYAAEAARAAHAIGIAHSAELDGARIAPVAATLPPALPAPPPPAHVVDPVVPVAVKETPREMLISIGGVAGSHNATVWMFHLRSKVSVNVGAGENQGHTITYHNVVGDLKAVGVWKGAPLAITLPRGAMAGLPHDGVAVVVQQEGYGHVIGATYLARPDYYEIR
jgi:hypothetical protein